MAGSLGDSMKIIGSFLAVLCAAMIACTTNARAQTAADNSSLYLYEGADRLERLTAKARQEGTLTLYTSMATTESGPLAAAFQRKYGIKVQLWRALSEEVLQRAVAEARGRRHTMDVVETNAPEWKRWRANRWWGNFTRRISPICRPGRCLRTGAG